MKCKHEYRNCLIWSDDMIGEPVGTKCIKCNKPKKGSENCKFISEEDKKRFWPHLYGKLDNNRIEK